MILDAIASAAAGSVFGAALFASGVHRPTIIQEQFQLHNFRMLHIFTIAMGSSA
jgi:hypothetical protein